MDYLPLHIDFSFRKHMIINRGFEPLLKENGLDDFDAIMKFDSGEVVKQKSKYRSTMRLNLPGKEGRGVVYLKRYRFFFISEFLKNCFLFFRTYSATHEWRTILKFKAVNLPTMIPIAVGMRWKIPFWNESFLITQEIPQTKTLEKELKNHFSSPLDSVRLKQKRGLIEKLAALTQKMHAEGFNHQDFYLCHILVNLNNADDPIFFIADLHRVKKKREIKKTWKVKDLAALNYSTPKKIISRADRLRFMKNYDPILAKDPAFLKAIVKKTEQIRHHEEKKRGKLTSCSTQP